MCTWCNTRQSGYNSTGLTEHYGSEVPSLLAPSLLPAPEEIVPSDSRTIDTGAANMTELQFSGLFFKTRIRKSHTCCNHVQVQSYVGTLPSMSLLGCLGSKYCSYLPQRSEKIKSFLPAVNLESTVANNTEALRNTFLPVLVDLSHRCSRSTFQSVVHIFRNFMCKTLCV